MDRCHDTWADLQAFDRWWCLSTIGACVVPFSDRCVSFGRPDVPQCTRPLEFDTDFRCPPPAAGDRIFLSRVAAEGA